MEYDNGGKERSLTYVVRSNGNYIVAMSILGREAGGYHDKTILILWLHTLKLRQALPLCEIDRVRLR